MSKLKAFIAALNRQLRDEAINNTLLEHKRKLKDLERKDAELEWNNKELKWKNEELNRKNEQLIEEKRREQQNIYNFKISFETSKKILKNKI